MNAMTEKFANDIISSIMNLKIHKMKNLEKSIHKKKGAFTLTLEDLVSELKVNLVFKLSQEKKKKKKFFFFQKGTRYQYF